MPEPNQPQAACKPTEFAQLADVAFSQIQDLRYSAVTIICYHNYPLSCVGKLLGSLAINQQ